MKRYFVLTLIISVILISCFTEQPTKSEKLTSKHLTPAEFNDLLDKTVSGIIDENQKKHIVSKLHSGESYDNALKGLPPKSNKSKQLTLTEFLNQINNIESGEIVETQHKEGKIERNKSDITDVGIFLHVKCSNENLKKLIEKHIDQELRSVKGVRMVLTSLGEILIASENMPFTHCMQLLVSEADRLGIGKTGEIAISVVHIEYIDPAPELTSILKDRLLPQTYNAVANDLVGKKWLLPIEVYRYHYLRLGHKRDLQSICKKIVTDFDKQTFQLARKR